MHFRATVSRVDASAYADKRWAISATKALPALPHGILKSVSAAVNGLLMLSGLHDWTQLHQLLPVQTVAVALPHTEGHNAHHLWGHSGKKLHSLGWIDSNVWESQAASTESSWKLLRSSEGWGTF